MAYLYKGVFGCISLFSPSVLPMCSSIIPPLINRCVIDVAAGIYRIDLRLMLWLTVVKTFGILQRFSVRFDGVCASLASMAWYIEQGLKRMVKE